MLSYYQTPQTIHEHVVQHLKKVLNILLTIALIGVLCLFGFLVAGILVIQDKYEPEPKQHEIEITEYEIEPFINKKMIEFLENPIDLNEYKSIKGQSLSSVTNGTKYYFTPQIKDSIYYHYTTFPNNSLWSEIAPFDVVVFKYGKNKHTWKDKTEILIEFTVSGKDSDLK